MWSWYLIVLVMCISLMISNIERLLLAFSILSLEKCLFKSLAYFWTGLFDFLLLLSFMNSVYILETIPLSDMFVCKYFLPFSGLSFQFIDSVLWCTKLKFWLNPTYVFFCCWLCFWCNICWIQCHENFPCFKSYKVTVLSFRTSIHSELIFVYGVKCKC